MSSRDGFNRGRSLNPASRSEEVVQSAWRDGAIGAMCALVPAGVGVWYGMKYSDWFRRSTNNQSRTALVIMPALAVFSLVSERKVEQMKREIANNMEHKEKMFEWAQQERDRRRQARANSSDRSEEEHLSEIYRKTVLDSGFRIVPGNTLGVHHKIANFWQENPFKVLAGIGIPSILYIFKGRSEKAHLQVQSMIMHTRVFGQGLVIMSLLGIMGFKAYMDHEGKFITEADAEKRVEDMEDAHENFLMKLEQEDADEAHIKELVDEIRRAKKRRTQSLMAKEA